MDFEDEVLEILNMWLKDCKIQFYFVPMSCEYKCYVYFNNYNIGYNCTIPYNKELDAKKVTHALLQDISHNIMNRFFKE